MDTILDNQRLTSLKTKQLKVLRDKNKKRGAKGAIKKIASFPRKIAQNWLILSVAFLFDIFAMIPVISIVINACFGLILFMYFGPKKKRGESELLKIGLPMALGSIIDFFVGILPVNIAATLIRIALS